MKTTWQKLHREFAPSGEDEEGNPLAVECDWTEALSLGPVTLVRNVVRGDGRDYVTLVCVPAPLAQLLEVVLRDPVGDRAISKLTGKPAGVGIIEDLHKMAQEVEGLALPKAPTEKFDLIDRLLRPVDEEGNLLPPLISTEEAGVLLGVPSLEEAMRKADYAEPHAQHLREGGWTYRTNSETFGPYWSHAESTAVLPDQKARALYDAEFRWSKTNQWWHWKVMADGMIHTANGTTTEALAWLKERTS